MSRAVVHTLLVAFIASIAAWALLPAAAPAQVKSMHEPAVSTELVRPAGYGGGGGGLSSLFGLMNPENFMMRHTLSYSYLSSGGAGMSIASYTNSIFYRIANPLDVRFDVTLAGSPFGPTAGMERSSLNGIFLSRAELNYRPWDDMLIQVQYRDLPFSYYGLHDSPFTFGRFGDY